MGRSILVVDDQWVMRELIRDILMMDGHEVRLASSAREALYQARAADFDLVILDARLPGGDGWDVLRTLRLECPERPIVMVTGSAPDEEWDRLAAGDPTGPFDIIEKPFQVSTFRATVGRALASPPRPDVGLSAFAGDWSITDDGRPEERDGG